MFRPNPDGPTPLCNRGRRRIANRNMWQRERIRTAHTAAFLQSSAAESEGNNVTSYRPILFAFTQFIFAASYLRWAATWLWSYNYCMQGGAAEEFPQVNAGLKIKVAWNACFRCVYHRSERRASILSTHQKVGKVCTTRSEKNSALAALSCVSG